MELCSRFRHPDDIKSLKAIQAHTSYYKRFEKTYHLLQQLKTTVVKQRPLPTVSALMDVTDVHGHTTRGTVLMYVKTCTCRFD